jgi:arsenate reductase (thioredoxin)
MKVLFICRGNVARSQFGEIFLNKLTEGKHTAISAGTVVANKEGNSKDGQKFKDLSGAEPVVEVMKEVGIDILEKARYQLTPTMVDEADKIIVMAEKESIPDYLSKSDKVVTWNVEDPKGKSLEFTRNIRDQVLSLVVDLVKKLG